MVLHEPGILLGQIEAVVLIHVTMLTHLWHHRELKVLLLKIIRINVPRAWYLI